MTVERIFVGSPPEGLLVEREQVMVAAGSGIEGDRYFGRHEEPGQNITLVEAEEIEAFLTAQGRAIDLSVTRRNLVTRGVRLNDLVGREFLVGEVRLRGVELCEPCLGLGGALATPVLAAAEVVRHFLRRGGLRADVLSSGAIARGAAVRKLA
jgi:MOSC domain-containing protein YiiM